MKKMALSFILVACAGCNMLKETPSEENLSRKEIVSIKISKQNHGSYSAIAKWSEVDPTSLEVLDIKSQAQTYSLANSWAKIRVVEIPEGYYAKTKIMVDGEMIEVPNGYGSSLSVFITPHDKVVEAKGVFSVLKKGEHIEFPFSGEFELGEATTVYEREEHFGANAHAVSDKKIQGAPLFFK